MERGACWRACHGGAGRGRRRQTLKESLQGFPRRASRSADVDRLQLRVVTIIDLPPITIIDVSRGPRSAVPPLASALLSGIIVPFPLVFRWRNGERTNDLAQTLVDHGTSFCVGPQRPCTKSRSTLRACRPRDAKRTAKSARLWVLVQVCALCLQRRTCFDENAHQTDVRRQRSPLGEVLRSITRMSLA
jgi:hypothetical protein